ncbi:uncharacterized protein LOC143882975 [Tasmannia lanceolata]|uniref:uncharacterized protein LOC143882975 n=1 Tax=Tasmannia lanceolata TaxID=3420 RepID=UPI004063449D
MKDYVNDCCEGWDAHGNYSCVLKGRIWILWDKAMIKLKIVEESSQHIHCEVEVIQTGMSFIMTSVYAHNYYISRRELWSKLENIASSNQAPWIVLGDFNAVRSQEERYGYPPNIAQMEEFNSCLTNSALTDLRSVGLNLTWNNKGKLGNLKMAKLDRSLVNEEWLHSYPNSFTEFIAPGISGHNPFIVSCSNHQSLGPRPFKFMDMWLDDQSLYPIVERAWNLKVKGNPMYSFVQKLKMVKNHIKAWNREVFGRIDIKVPIIRKSLLNVQAKIEKDPTSNHLLEKEANLRENLIRYSSLEESFLKQKSRVQWLPLGDSNSKFFYSHLKGR